MTAPPRTLFSRRHVVAALAARGNGSCWRRARCAKTPPAMRSPCTANRRCRKGLRISPTPTRPRPRAGAGAGRARHLRQPQSVHREGPAAHGHAGALVGIIITGGYVVESLMARGYDEPFTLYGLVARAVATDSARSFVTFELDPAARFSDGKPITPEDVLFSWQLLRDKGRPNHRIYYSKVVKARGDRTSARPLRSRRQRRPRAAADPRADAGAAEARDRSRRRSRKPPSSR